MRVETKRALPCPTQLGMWVSIDEKFLPLGMSMDDYGSIGLGVTNKR